MGIKFWEVVCGENGIGGSGKYRGDNDAHFDSINMLYHEASFLDLEPGVISAVPLSRCSANSSARKTS